MNKNLGTTLLSLFRKNSSALSKVEIKIMLLQPDIIIGAFIETETLSDYIKDLNTEVEAHLKSEKGNKEVFILIETFTDKDAAIRIGARPKISEKSLIELTEKLQQHPSPRSRIGSVAFAIVATINKGSSKKNVPYIPNVEYKGPKDLEAFSALSLSDKQAALQDWIRQEVLPVTAHVASAVDAEFKGVRALGKILGENEFLETDIEQLTSYNPEYWRANIEMAVGDLIVPFSKMCMHLVKGEFDCAKRYVLLCQVFAVSERSTVPRAYIRQIAEMLEMIEETLGQLIQKGITLHDQGKYEEAIEHYQKLLLVSPQSAWLNYQVYFAQRMMLENPNEYTELWNTAKKSIYTFDPMYAIDVSAETGREIYLLYRRREIPQLFASQDTFIQDFINYADIAVDLENYGFAAHLYWLMLSSIKREEYGNRNMLAHFLYCLDKLGNKETIQNFEGDFSEEFENIEKERIKLMKESDVYKSRE